MRWLVAMFVVGFVAAMARSFVWNARAIRRDAAHRFDMFQAQLEARASSLVDAWLRRDLEPKDRP